MIQTVVEEFTKLNEGLKAKLVEIESTGQAVSIGQQVLSDPDLMFLVHTWPKSELLREKIRSYRGGRRSSSYLEMFSNSWFNQ